jgi:hypothetical protein
MLFSCQRQVPCFEINYGNCACNASLDFVYFLQHVLLRANEEQLVLINCFAMANISGLAKNVRRKTGIAASRAKMK